MLYSLKNRPWHHPEISDVLQTPRSKSFSDNYGKCTIGTSFFAIKLSWGYTGTCTDSIKHRTAKRKVCLITFIQHLYIKQLTRKRHWLGIVEDIEKLFRAHPWLQSWSFNRWDRWENMTSHSYVARPREVNIAMKVKENHCQIQGKRAIGVLIQIGVLIRRWQHVHEASKSD